MPANDTTRILVKITESADPLAAAPSTARLRPLYPPVPGDARPLTDQPRWFLADLPVKPTSPWDIAHQQIAGTLNLEPSAIIFAEPDLLHTIYPDDTDPDTQLKVAGDDCTAHGQDTSRNKIAGPDQFAWHLDDTYTRLRAARARVAFSDPRTRIAHIDTGYYPRHETTPAHLARHLERNFAHDGPPDSAADPNPDLLLDNSGHGTGTIGILAGNRVAAAGDDHLGGAPDAEILPLRIADRVVLFTTSALAQAVTYATDQRCDVISLSMGGLPSRAWAEAVDNAYEHGVVFCAAAGNHISVSPSGTVYPARFPRVLSVCGVMANHTPYTGLTGTALQGNSGPKSAMDHALSAYTPNIDWPLWGCPTGIRHNGEGTSSATPQVAAAAALWIEHYKTSLPRTWQRVEAARHALFSSATRHADRDHVGHGILHADHALDIKPTFGLSQSKRSSTSLAFLRIITGIGLTTPTVQEEMFNLEIAQLLLTSPTLAALIPDPDAITTLPDDQATALMAALLNEPRASEALRRQVAGRYRSTTRGAPAPPHDQAATDGGIPAAADKAPALTAPPHRLLRVYAIDPTLATQLDRSLLSEATLQVHWEPLPSAADRPAPSQASHDFGDYFAIADQDPSGRDYGVAALNDPRVAVQNGYAPSETNPHFHQQMVYAVALATVERFERALGRPVLWRGVGRTGDSYRPRLTLRPHALYEPNAYYSPAQGALLFGYFDSSADDPLGQWSGSRTYTCLSHDIVAHETTHAILDGMHRHFNDATNPDVLAFHEAFADIVALLQRFTLTELLAHEIRQSRGNLEAETPLGSLAAQFGRATGRHGPLRDAIGQRVGASWIRATPDPTLYPTTLAPHARGAILVRAVFDAYLAIYKTRTQDLIRLATGGSGVLTGGAIPEDLVTRLADEASKAAGHALSMIIRAIDYLPPIDPTFHEFLRALITADLDLINDDTYRYRVAFIEAFRRHGIRPLDPEPLSTAGLSTDALRWNAADLDSIPARERAIVKAHNAELCEELKSYADACVYLRDRRALSQHTGVHRRRLQSQLQDAFTSLPRLADQFGVPEGSRFDVQELRRAVRVDPDGRPLPQVVVSIVQRVPTRGRRPTLRGGCTIVMDLLHQRIIYRIGKGTGNAARRDRTSRFLADTDADPLRKFLLGTSNPEPFALLHDHIVDR
ncbi:MAG TPA: S8 family serine peptidase [Microlunatus sp.]